MWYYEQNGQSLGPVNADVLANLVSSGVIQPQTQVCREGETVWNPAFQTELASLFSKTALKWMGNPVPGAPPLPGQQPIAQTASFNRVGGPKDMTSLTTALKILLGAGIFMSFVGIMSAWSSYDLFNDLANGVYATEEEAFQANGGQTILALFLGLFQNLLGIGTIVVFAIWIFKACSNAHLLSERPMKYTPGWAVGWYFIPIANLVKPYEAMREIFQVSTTSRFGRSKSTAIVNLWWTLWIVCGVLGVFTTMRYFGADNYEAMKSASLLTMANGGLGILLSIVAIMMIGQIIEGQAGLSKRTVTMQPQPVA